MVHEGTLSSRFIFLHFAPGLLHINLGNFCWGVSHDQSFGVGVNYLKDPLWPRRALCHFFPPEAETVSPLHFQSKDACILSDCVSVLQSYGFIWQGLKCRSDCFISIQIFFQLDRDQKVVSSVSENGLEYKYRRAGGGGVRFPSLALLWCHDLNHSLAWMMIWPRDFLCSCLVCGKT